MKYFRIYGTLGFIRLSLDYLYTKLLYGHARLIRRPFYLRGRRHVDFGCNLTTGVALRLDAFSDSSSGILIRFGNNVQINDYVHIAAVCKVEIGDNTLIASRVFISDHNHGCFDNDSSLNAPNIPPSDRPLCAKGVVIGRNVWIGEQVCILSGVTIGDGAVIGAGSVVARSIPKNCVAVGNPARVLRVYEEASRRWVRYEKAKDSSCVGR